MKIFYYELYKYFFLIKRLVYMIGIIMTFVSGLVLSFSLGNIVNQRHEKTEYLKQTFAHECFESELIN